MTLSDAELVGKMTSQTSQLFFEKKNLCVDERWQDSPKIHLCVRTKLKHFELPIFEP